MPETPACDRFQLHDQAFYNVWKGQLYVRDQLICDVAFQSPTNCCIPSQLSDKLVIKEVIRGAELRKALPKGIFEKLNFTGQEVCCESVYCSFFQVFTSSAKGSHVDKLKKWMEENDLAIIRFLNDRGVLVLLPSTGPQFKKDLKWSGSYCLVALFLYPHTKVLGEIEREEWASKFTNQAISLKVTQLLPGLPSAIVEACSSHKEDKANPDVLFEQYLKKYANLQKKKESLILDRHLKDTATLFSGDFRVAGKSGKERCSRTAFVQLRSYISSPHKFCVSVPAVSAFVAGESSNMSEAGRSSNKGVSVYSSLVAAAFGPEAKTADQPKKEGELREVEKKSPTRNGKKKASRQGKDTSVQVASPSPSKNSPDVSDNQMHSSQSKNQKPVSSSSKTMLKLANAQFSNKKKRGAEVLTAEFVQGSTVSVEKAGASSKRRKKEYAVSPPKRIMPVRIKRNVLPPQQPAEPERSPDRPPKRKASEQAAINAFSESKVKLENLRRLVNKHAEEVGRHPRKNAGKLKKEQENPVTEIKEVPPLEQKELSYSTDMLMENIFERRVNMYESHALNLLADLALNSYGTSGIPYAPIENTALKHKELPEEKTVQEDGLEDRIRELVNSPCSHPMVEPSSALHPVLPQESSETLEKVHIMPSNESNASQVTTTSLRPSNESSEKFKVNFALAKGKARSNATSKICLEHSYSQLPLDLANTSPVSLDSKEVEAQTLSEPSALPAAVEVVFEPPADVYYPNEFTSLADDKPVECPVIKKEPRDVLKFGDNFLITFNWEGKYDFDLDSKFTSDPLEKTINRALHGPWNPHLKEKVEDVKIILHMWLALFYNRSNRQLSCSSRKVVEHSNPAKYVSINTIMDPFELYEIVDSENVDAGLSQLPAGSPHAPVGSSSHISNTGMSLDPPLPTAHKSEKKQKRTHGKNYLGVAASALQQLNAEKVKRDDNSKEVCSPDKTQQNTDSDFCIYRRTDFSSPSKINISSKSPKRKVKHEPSLLGISFESVNFHQVDMVSLQDVDKSKIGNSLLSNSMKFSFPHGGNDSPLAKKYSVSKNLPDNYIVRLPFLPENKMISDGKEAGKLSEHDENLTKLERTPNSTNPPDSEIGEQGAVPHENVCDPKENLESETKKAESELEGREDDATNLIHLKSPNSITLSSLKKDVRRNGIHEPIDLTLPHAKDNGVQLCKSELLIFKPQSEIPESRSALTGSASTDPLVNGELQVSKPDHKESCKILLGRKDTASTDIQTPGSEKDSRTSDSEAPNTKPIEEPKMLEEPSHQSEESNPVNDIVDGAKPLEGSVLDNENKSRSTSNDGLFEDPENRVGRNNDQLDITQQPPVGVQREDVSGDGQSENPPCNAVSDESIFQADRSIEAVTVSTGLINKHTPENPDQTLNSNIQTEQSNREKCDATETKHLDHFGSAPNENIPKLNGKDHIGQTQPDLDSAKTLNAAVSMMQEASREEPEVSTEICREPRSLKAVEELDRTEPVEKDEGLSPLKDEVASVATTRKKNEKEQITRETKVSQGSHIDSLEPLKEKCLIQEQITEKAVAIPQCVPTENIAIFEGMSSAIGIISDPVNNGKPLNTHYPIEVLASPVKDAPFSGEVKPAGVFEVKTKIPSPSTHAIKVIELDETSKIHKSITPQKEMNLEQTNTNAGKKDTLPSESLSILTDLFVDEYDGEETDKLVQKAITALDHDLKDIDESCHYQSPLESEFARGSSQVEIIDIEDKDESASQNEKLPSTLHFDLISPADSVKNLSICSDNDELNAEIIIDLEKEKHSPKSGYREAAITDEDDTYESDVTDVSTDFPSPDRFNAMNDECDIIILDGNTSLSNGEPEPVNESISILEENRSMLPTQGDFAENMEHDIIQEHSDICFIASTASISEEQYERWSDASHKDIEFLQHIHKLPHKGNDVPGITPAVDSCPPSPRSSSPVETTPCHEPTTLKRSRRSARQSDSCSLLKEADEYLPRHLRSADYHGSRKYGNFTIMDSTRESGRTAQPVYKSRSESLFSDQRATSEDLTQNTLDLEHLRFIHRLKVVLRNACTDNFFSDPPSRSIFETRTISSCTSSSNRKKLSPLLITIHCSTKKKHPRSREQRGESNYTQTYEEEPPMERSSYHPRAHKPVRTHRRASPFHFSRLKYENKHDKSNSDISLILNECVQTNHLKLSRLSLSNMLTDRNSSVELPDECAQTKKTFAPPSHKVPAFKNIISDLCTSLHSRLHSVVKECGQKTFRYYIHETSDDPFFSQSKSLLKKDGHTATDPQHFCNSKHMESDRLLVIIRNEDISAQIHKIPCLAQLKLYPNVSFVGVDCPEDIIDSTHQELFHSGGFVVSDQSILETITLGKLKEVAAILEKLNKRAVWKWLVHYRENRKLKEDKRPDSVSHLKITVLRSYQQMNIVQVLPYHQCDSKLKAPTEGPACVVNLQSQHIHSRLAVYLTEKPSSMTDDLQHKGVLVFDVDTFIRKIQKLNAQLQA